MAFWIRPLGLAYERRGIPARKSPQTQRSSDIMQPQRIHRRIIPGSNEVDHA